MRGILTAALLLGAAPVAAAAVGVQPGNPSSAAAWEIGPIDRHGNTSVGMPDSPTQGRRGWYFDFPYPHVGAGHVHYVTFDPGSLAGKRRIVMRYRIDAARGVRFVPRENNGQPATISLYFQRRGDNWSARGRFAGYRWYAPAHTVREIRPGEHELVVNFGDDWTSVMGMAAARDPRGFQEALANAGRVGFVFGTSAARGHGVFATGPARLTVTHFEIL